MEEQDPEAILRGLRQRDDRAYEHLLTRCLPPFANYVRRDYPQLAEDTADLFQEAMAELIRHLNNHPDFTPDQDIHKYFFTVLKNTCRAAARRHNRLPLAGGEAPWANVPAEETRNDQLPINLDDYRACWKKLFEENEKAALVIIHRDAEAFERLPHYKKGTCFEEVAYKSDEQLSEELEFENSDSVKVLRSRWRERLEMCLLKKAGLSKNNYLACLEEIHKENVQAGILLAKRFDPFFFGKDEIRERRKSYSEANLPGKEESREIRKKFSPELKKCLQKKSRE